VAHEGVWPARDELMCGLQAELEREMPPQHAVA
jgi:hypothetical protein